MEPVDAAVSGEQVSVHVAARAADTIVIQVGEFGDLVVDVEMTRANLRALIHELQCAHTSALGLEANAIRRELVGHE
jgi:hypothetical protein